MVEERCVSSGPVEAVEEPMEALTEPSPEVSDTSKDVTDDRTTEPESDSRTEDVE